MLRAIWDSRRAMITIGWTSRPGRPAALDRSPSQTLHPFRNCPRPAEYLFATGDACSIISSPSGGSGAYPGLEVES